MKENNIKKQIIDVLNIQKEKLDEIISKSDLDTTKQYYKGVLDCCDHVIDYINKTENN